MKPIYIILIVISSLLLITLLILYKVYRMAFYNDAKFKKEANEPLKGKQYKPFEDKMWEIINNAKKYEYKEVFIKSYDNKTLCAKLYIQDESYPFQIQCHGYKGSGLRCFAGGLDLAIKAKFNVVLIDQRGHGKSQGRTITFGVKERKDVLSWVNYVNENYNYPNIYLAGVSMGAATALMASSFDYKDNVKGVIADCPYSSIKEIVYNTAKHMNIPAFFYKPALNLAALIYANFNLNETSPIEEVKKSKLPVLIIHGTVDKFVPCEMSIKMANECANVQLVLIEDAPHGMSYVKDYDTYSKAVYDFIKRTNK